MLHQLQCMPFILDFFCIPESFNTNISHQLFDYIKTFVKSQQLNKKVDFVLKTGFERSF